jgi:hypothetical protein
MKKMIQTSTKLMLSWKRRTMVMIRPQRQMMVKKMDHPRRTHASTQLLNLI